MTSEQLMRRAAGLAAEDVERVVVWPHRSLSCAGTRLLLGAVGGVFALVAAWALRQGAWPMALYVTLAFGGFALALSRNVRAGRLCQTIELASDAIRVHQAGPAARTVSTVEFSPFWVRIDEAHGPGDDWRLVLRQSGRSVSIGEFLSPDERQELAVVLRARIADRYRSV